MIRQDGNTAEYNMTTHSHTDRPLTFKSITGRTIPAEVRISQFRGTGNTTELHITAHPLKEADPDTQLEWILRAYQHALVSCECDIKSAVFRRFFCSDLANQSDTLSAYPLCHQQNTNNPCAVSWIEQPPIHPGKISLWAYHIIDPNGNLIKSQNNSSLMLEQGELTHHWTTGITEDIPESSEDQTHSIFQYYERYLKSNNITLADNVLRTWLFVKDIDNNYAGLADARREHFTKHGLNPKTHYIASTGIEGGNTNPKTLITMDAYAIAGIQPEQIQHINALDHLSHTHLYGVTFERATSIAYRDRKHIFISGTASIDNKGNILHIGDVDKQLDRTLENIRALLTQTNATLNDMAIFIVYVRSPHDLESVQTQMKKRFKQTPFETVLAPVCRPDWLVEVEGIAIIPESNPDLPEY